MLVRKPKPVHDPGPDPLAKIRDDIVGNDAEISTPFGTRRVAYADYTASGRMLHSVERFLSDVVHPMYANTHTEASATGHQTSVFREQAREIVSRSLNASPDEYAVLFTGTGTTGAIDKLGRVLGILLPEYANKKWKLDEQIPEEERPVIFHGPFEHHTNELWWRESIATVVAVEEDASGRPDLEQLRAALISYAHRPLKIGSFSAGSNVTGIRADTSALAELLHSHGALAFFDCAGIAAYVALDANPPPSKPGADPSMDALFISPHKFIGGPGSSGLLVAKRKLFTNQRPTVPGGGTVTLVSQSFHEYDPLIEAREDGGTPGILQAIRCGLAFQIKERVGAAVIEAFEQRYGRAAISMWSVHPSIMLMGADRSGFFEYDNRVSILSFNILAPSELGTMPLEMPPSMHGRKLLHPHFITQLLNDVYGIQSRSGCSCAGPYGHRLMKLAGAVDDELHCLISGGEGVIKPGWARVNFNYFIGDNEAHFIREAVLQVAEHGWRLLPLYVIDPASGQFIHRSFDSKAGLRSLDEHSLGATNLESHRVEARNSSPRTYRPMRPTHAAAHEAAAYRLTQSEGSHRVSGLEPWGRENSIRFKLGTPAELSARVEELELMKKRQLVAKWRKLTSKPVVGYRAVLDEATQIYARATQLLEEAGCSGLREMDDYLKPPTARLHRMEWWATPSAALAHLKNAMPLSAPVVPSTAPATASLQAAAHGLEMKQVDRQAEIGKGSTVGQTAKDVELTASPHLPGDADNHTATSVDRLSDTSDTTQPFE